MKYFRVGYQLFVNVGFINKPVCTVSSVKAELSVSFIIKLDKCKGSVVLGVLFEIITVDAAALDGFNQKFTRKIISDLADESRFKPCPCRSCKHIQRRTARFTDKAHIADRINPVGYKVYKYFAEGGYVIFSHGCHPFQTDL